MSRFLNPQYSPTSPNMYSTTARMPTPRHTPSDSVVWHYSADPQYWYYCPMAIQQVWQLVGQAEPRMFCIAGHQYYQDCVINNSIFQKMRKSIAIDDLLPMQNTQRIVYTTTNSRQQPTARKDTKNQDTIAHVLQQYDLLQIYNHFIAFHCQLQQLTSEGEQQQLGSLCQQFRNKMYDSFTEVDENCERIKDLLEEVNCLRRRLADLDGSLVMDSISSLEEYGHSEFSASHTQHPADHSGSKYVFNIVDQQRPQGVSHEQLVNFMELKSISFQLLSLLWRLTSLHHYDESIVILEGIRNLNATEQAKQGEVVNPEQESIFLNTMYSLALVCRALVDSICHQQAESGRQSEGTDNLCINHE